MKSNSLKALPIILALATASVSYQANATEPTKDGIETVVQDGITRIRGKVIYVDEETITAYKGSPSKMTALAPFNYETMKVVTLEGDTLNLLIPQPVEYAEGDSFNERVDMQKGQYVRFGDLVRDYSDFNGSLQPGYIKVDGIIDRK